MSRKLFKKAIGLLLASSIAVSSSFVSVYAEEVDIEESENTFLDYSQYDSYILIMKKYDISFLDVASRTLDRYAKRSAGLEVNISEEEFNFLDINKNNDIDVDDATIFLDLYAKIAAGLINTDITTTTTTETTTSTENTTEISIETGTEDTTTSISENITTEFITSDTVLDTTTSTAKTTSNTTATAVSTTKPKTTTSTAKTTSNTIATAVSTTKPKTTTSVAKTTSNTTTTTASTTKPNTTTAITTISTIISTGTTMSTKSVYNGIDVSTYQGLIDWNKAKADGVEFGIMRAGYGKYASQEDRYFKTNMKNAKAAGVPCGAYWFSYALTPQEAIQEADAFYTVIKDYKMEYPVSFDMETGDQSNLSKSQVSAIIDAFCSRMESYGYYVTLYSYASFLNSKVSDEIFEKYDIWVAHYGVSSPSFYRDYGLWQYSSTGSVSGISGPVDRDYAYLPYEAIIKENHFNGY